MTSKLLPIVSSAVEDLPKHISLLFGVAPEVGTPNFQNSIT